MKIFSIKGMLLSLLLRPTASAIVENKPTLPYHIEQTLDGSYWAVSNDRDIIIRYPCTLVPTAFSVLLCVDMDGNAIDHSDIDYRNSKVSWEESPEEGQNQPSPTGGQQQESPCYATPADFDGPGGIVCPPSMDNPEDSTAARTTVNAGDTEQDTILYQQSMMMTRLKAIIGLVVVVLGSIFMYFAWVRDCCQSTMVASDSKSVATDIVKDDEDQDNTFGQV